jgi:predicted RNA-binding protein with RPS1 domain
MELKKQTSTQETTWDDNYWFYLSTQGRKGCNESLSEKHGLTVYSFEPYADDLAKLYSGITEVANKEPKVGEIYQVMDVRVINSKELHLTLSGFLDAVVNLEHEKKFISMIGMDEDSFIESLKTEAGRVQFCTANYHVRIEIVTPYIKASLYEGQLSHVKEDFFSQIKKPTSAYHGTITGKNQGGFIISVEGVNGFLPGSLAAANVVRDFDDMIGKVVPVMVEDFLVESNIFVFSYKKYLSYILPSKIESIDLDKKYTGTITGLAKYGIFVEFDEIFTGLLHSSKMSNELKDKFKNYEFRPGDVVEFWIKEITADKKIILSDEDPSVRIREIEEFKEKNLGVIRGGEVVSIQPFGALIKLQKDIVGLISQKEIKTKKKRYNVGDKVMVTVERVHNDKIFLTIPNEG